MATVKVWDAFVRLFHWALVASFTVAFLSGEERDLRMLHYWAGYAAAALVALRILWGVIGTHYARFSQFVHGPKIVLNYLKSVVTGREARYLGHNPAGGVMIVLLLLAITGLSLTGHLLTTDAFWGSTTMEEIHEALAKGILALVVLHVSGVIVESLRHRENLVRAMITGKKKVPGPADVR